MRVRDVVERVLALGHQGVSDAELQNQALGWVNAAQRELVEELMPLALALLQRSAVVVTNAQGVAQLPELPGRVMQVFARDSGMIVPLVTPAELAALDPTGTAVGPVARCVWVGSEIRVHPVQVVALLVVYLPAAREVTLDDDGSGLVLPEAWHGSLVWGALVWSSLFERGFASASDLMQHRNQWWEAKASLKLAVLGQSGPPLRVQPFMLI